MKNPNEPIANQTRDLQHTVQCLNRVTTHMDGALLPMTKSPLYETDQWFLMFVRKRTFS